VSPLPFVEDEDSTAPMPRGHGAPRSQREVHTTSFGPPETSGDRAERTIIFSKTKMCKFHILGMCAKGDGCKFAHHKDELNPVPDLSRTKLCKTLISTGSCEDPHCSYAHSREELRSMPTVPHEASGYDAVGNQPSACVDGGAAGGASDGMQAKQHSQVAQPQQFVQQFGAQPPQQQQQLLLQPGTAMLALAVQQMQQPMSSPSGEALGAEQQLQAQQLLIAQMLQYSQNPALWAMPQQAQQTAFHQAVPMMQGFNMAALASTSPGAATTLPHQSPWAGPQLPPEELEPQPARGAAQREQAHMAPGKGGGRQQRQAQRQPPRGEGRGRQQLDQKDRGGAGGWGRAAQPQQRVENTFGNLMDSAPAVDRGSQSAAPAAGLPLTMRSSGQEVPLLWAPDPAVDADLHTGPLCRMGSLGLAIADVMGDGGSRTLPSGLAAIPEKGKTGGLEVEIDPPPAADTGKRHQDTPTSGLLSCAGGANDDGGGARTHLGTLDEEEAELATESVDGSLAATSFTISEAPAAGVTADRQWGPTDFIVKNTFIEFGDEEANPGRRKGLRNVHTAPFPLDVMGGAGGDTPGEGA